MALAISAARIRTRAISLSRALVTVLVVSNLFPAHAQTPPVDVDCAAPPPALLDVSSAWQRLDRCNRELVAARRAVGAASADLRVATQSPNPTISGGIGGVSPSSGVGPGPLRNKAVDSSVRVEQLIERGGKLSLRRRSAEQLLQAAELDLAEMRREQGSAMLTALVDLAAAIQRTSLLDEVTQLYAETSRASAQRLARGDIARLDVQRQTIDALRAQADLRQAQADVQRARLILASLLGWEGFASALVPDPAVLDMMSESSGAAAPGDRADVRAAQRRVDAALAARDLARAQAHADVTVGVQFDHYPQNGNNTNGTGNTFSVSASIPLLVRHRFEGEIAKAQNDYYAAEETLRRTLASAQNDWARINADLAAALARFHLLQRELAPQAEDVARAAETGYAKGALGVLDVLEARRTARQTRLDLLAARADVARASVQQEAWLRSERE